jgi:hypothetical protein
MQFKGAGLSGLLDYQGCWIIRAGMAAEHAKTTQLLELSKLGQS